MYINHMYTRPSYIAYIYIYNKMVTEMLFKREAVHHFLCTRCVADRVVSGPQISLAQRVIKLAFCSSE